MISIITPAFNEEANLAPLHQRMVEVLTALSEEWEWIVVDDHSSDGSFLELTRLAALDPRVRGVRLARNSGSHIALTCGLRLASGDCAILLAADLQDPPETVSPLLECWRSGAQVVWAVRAARDGESRSKVGVSLFYYWIMRKIVGIRDMPSTGADFFLLDRAVIDAINRFEERNVSLFALVTWMGFRQEKIEYVKQARLHGASGWTLRKKLKLLVDSVTSFSYVPIRFMSYTGMLVSVFGFLYLLVILLNRSFGRPPEGWTALMVVVLVVGGLQMMMLGVLGEYLWRVLDESRRRPAFLVEAATPVATFKKGSSRGEKT